MKQNTLQSARRYGLHNLVVDASTDTSALTAPVASPTQPTDGLIVVAAAPLTRLVFGLTNADDETCNYQVIGWYKVKMPGSVADTWIGVVLAKGLATAGSLAIAGITTGFWVDTITDDVTTRTSVTSTLANHVAMLTVDTHNARLLQIQTDLGTAAAAYAWAIPGEFAR